MGCTSSKEEEDGSPNPIVLGGGTNTTDKEKEKSHPMMKKVQTNFSDVNYTEPATGRRDTVYAPSEVPEAQRPSVVSEVSGVLAGGGGAVSGDGVRRGVVGGSVVGGVEGIEGGDGDGEDVRREVPWDALSPGSTGRLVG
ncbi:hypothetical protein EG328_001374 [Venturia inaequalis]|uniref:Uncharacterized protein n=1 Tax=Venturia inaequalis TaxID=5025 RepID=A0A8H3UZS8_VENIN|nr:hypothetical protein EG328_001374 [Venturia inaequalis]